MVIKRRCNSCKQTAEFPCSCCGNELHHVDCSDRSCEKHWEGVEKFRLNEIENLNKKPKSVKEEIEEELASLKEYKKIRMDGDTTTSAEIKQWIVGYIDSLEQGFEKELTKWEDIKNGIEKETDLVRLVDGGYWDTQIQTLQDDLLPADKQSIVLKNRQETCYGQLEKKQGITSQSLVKGKGTTMEVVRMEQRLELTLSNLRKYKPEEFYSRPLNRPENASCPHWQQHCQRVIEYQAVEQVGGKTSYAALPWKDKK